MIGWEQHRVPVADCVRQGEDDGMFSQLVRELDGLAAIMGSHFRYD